MTRVLFFGTHPRQFNGYSKVVYELAKCLCKRDDIELSIFGFQNFYENDQHRKDLPANVFVHDAYANENPKGSGFGVEQVKDFVIMNKPDVVIVYNDLLVISQIVNQLKTIEGRKFKIIAYVDQVYLNQKKDFIDYINKNIDVAMCFTEEWEKCLKDQGVTIPTCFLPHGFNNMHYFPIPKKLARQYYGLKEEDFIILNLNRNQPRKRWDVCLKAFADIVSRFPNEPIKLMIATALQGAWNLIEIYERELKKRNISLEEGIKHLIIIDNPQKITDEQTNILYNIADIGINTCDGEGFGLCNFEQAAIGIPQIVPRLGGFLEYLNDENAFLIDPKMAYYVDNTRDMVCGEALICDYADFVDAVEDYYKNRDLVKKHGEKCRTAICAKYSWEKVEEKLYSIIMNTVNPTPDATSSAALVEQVEQIDIENIKKVTDKKLIPVVMEQDEDAGVSKVTSIKKKKPSKKDQKNIDRKIRKLQQQLDKLVSVKTICGAA